jgi:hypothetical protein
MPDNKIKKEYEELLRKADEIPGIKELSEVYGSYEAVLQQSQEYLMETRQRSIVSTTNSTQ